MHIFIEILIEVCMEEDTRSSMEDGHKMVHRRRFIKGDPWIEMDRT